MAKPRMLLALVVGMLLIASAPATAGGWKSGSSISLVVMSGSSNLAAASSLSARYRGRGYVRCLELGDRQTVRPAELLSGLELGVQRAGRVLRKLPELPEQPDVQAFVERLARRCRGLQGPHGDAQCGRYSLPGAGFDQFPRRRITAPHHENTGGRPVGRPPFAFRQRPLTARGCRDRRLRT